MAFSTPPAPVLPASAVQAGPPADDRARTAFVLGSMALAVGLLAYDARWNPGWIGASVWGYGLTALYVGYALVRRDELLGRFILFGLSAGWVELLPDAWLVGGTGTLVYPPGEPIVDASPLYMPFSWMVVFLQIGYVGWLLARRFGLAKATLMVAALGALVIPFYEHLAIAAGWWHYRNTPTLFNVPYYVILAEGGLMTTIPFMFQKCERARWTLIPVLGVIQGGLMWIACLVAYALVG